MEADARRDELHAAFDRITATAETINPDQPTQELAAIGTRSGVTKEINGLGVHVAAARALLEEIAPVGRKLDFLMPEFNREANTPATKSRNSALTATCLDLKTVIERMREQVQNVE